MLSKSGATNVTNFDDAKATQEIELYFANANTTLVHPGSWLLKSATNTTPANGQIVVLTRVYDNSIWVEKSRSC